MTTMSQGLEKTLDPGKTTNVVREEFDRRVALENDAPSVHFKDGADLEFEALIARGETDPFLLQADINDLKLEVSTSWSKLNADERQQAQAQFDVERIQRQLDADTAVTDELRHGLRTVEATIPELEALVRQGGVDSSFGTSVQDVLNDLVPPGTYPIATHPRVGKRGGYPDFVDRILHG